MDVDEVQEELTFEPAVEELQVKTRGFTAIKDIVKLSNYVFVFGCELGLGVRASTKMMANIQ